MVIGLLSWAEEDTQFQVALCLTGIVSNRVTQHLSLLAQRCASDIEFIMNTINNEGDDTDCGKMGVCIHGALIPH